MSDSNNSAKRSKADEMSAAPQAQQKSSPLLALLKLEADAREVGSIEELRYLITSETRKLTQARQCFVFDAKNSRRFVMEAASGVAFVDRSAALTLAIEHLIASHKPEDLLRAVEMDLRRVESGYERVARNYPFPFMLWAPFVDRGNRLVGGMLLAREAEWKPESHVVAKRLAGTFSHALRELASHRTRKLSFGRKHVVLATVLVGALGLVRVPVTAMAPFEITPRGAEVIAAPMDGIIEEVLVPPSGRVHEGQLLMRFASATLRNRLDVAEGELAVAEASLKQAMQSAFTDERGRRALAAASSQVEVKSAERNLARDLLDRSEVKSKSAGIAVYPNKDDLIGRPVATGERLMRIAKPDLLEAQLEVALTDSALLASGSKVRLFLDSDPLEPLGAELESADYKAKSNTGGQLVYRAKAKITQSAHVPRLGSRGTAQIVGESASLAYVIFRRPLSALRQRWAF